MNTSELASLAQGFLTHLRDRNRDGLQTLMEEGIVWSLPGRAGISGKAVGVAAVADRADRIASYGVDFVLKHVLFGENGFTLSLNNRARRGEVVLDEHLATVCTVSNHKITRIDTYLHDVEMMEAFFQ